MDELQFEPWDKEFPNADVVEHPDSGKVALGVLTPGADGKRALLRGVFRSDADVDYWDDE